MQAVTITVLFVLLAVAGDVSARKEQRLYRVKRVINGRSMNKTEFPFLVSIRARFWQKMFGFLPVPMVETCGASLLNNRWLLSAAHCFQEKINGNRVSLNKPSKWKAMLASKRRSPGFQDWIKHFVGSLIGRKKWIMWRVGIEKIIIHPQFIFRSGRNDQRGQLHYDIALLKLKESIPHQQHALMSPIRLPTATMSRANWPPTGTKCTFAGWGCNRRGGKAVKFATKVNFTVVDDSQCLSTYSTQYVNLQNDMCAGSFNGNKGICAGDSGGPLICMQNGVEYQAGIASATAASAPADFPGIFTRTSTFRNWIIRTMRNN